MGGDARTRLAGGEAHKAARPEAGAACAGGLGGSLPGSLPGTLPGVGAISGGVTRGLRPGLEEGGGGVYRAEPSCPSPGGITAGQAQVLLPAELIQPGEIIVLLLKPSPWFILLGPLKSLSLIALAGVGLYWVAQRAPIPLTGTDAVILTTLLLTLRLFWQFLEWLSRVYVLTDRRVIRVKGVLRIDVFETPLKNVQHTSTLFSLRERLVGLGTIAFATSGTAFIEAAWEMVGRPLEVHRVVVQTLNRYR
ncbi:MAG: PH domain-containing protein [Phycisphaeraceae bacterium]|nr:PH domain-containing protein [Phycisphaeraceae bacterium]